MNTGEYIQMPYYCDDCHTWHVMLYGENEEGIFEGDPDGNWEFYWDEALPTLKEQDQAWNDYADWVVNWGEDPLAEFARSKIRKTPEKWTFRVSRSLIGPIVISGRKAKDKSIKNVKDFPEHVRDYLFYDDQDCKTIAGTRSFEELTSLLKSPDTIKPWPNSDDYLLTCMINKTETIEPTKEQIRAAARKHLKGARHAKENA